MVTTRPETRRLLGLLYIVGILMAADQAADLLTTVLSAPATPSQAQWRFGVFGLLATRAGVFLVAEVLLFTPAVVLGHRKTLRFLGGINLVLALAALAGLAFFGLDAVEVRRGVDAATATQYVSAALRAGVVALLGAGVLGWSGWLAVRSFADETGRRRKGAPLIVESKQPRGRP